MENFIFYAVINTILTLTWFYSYEGIILKLGNIFHEDFSVSHPGRDYFLNTFKFITTENKKKWSHANPARTYFLEILTDLSGFSSEVQVHQKAFIHSSKQE